MGHYASEMGHDTPRVDDEHQLILNAGFSVTSGAHRMYLVCPKAGCLVDYKSWRVHLASHARIEQAIGLTNTY